MGTEEEDDIIVDPLFVGMTRPATVLGVPYSGVIIEVMLVAIIFLGTNNPLYIAVAIPIHSLLYLIGANDPAIYDSLNMAMKTITRCQNRRFWGAATFSPSKTKKWTK